MKRKVLALVIVFLGACVLAFPFARDLYNQRQTAKLLDKLDSGEAMVVSVQAAGEDDVDDWMEQDGLGTFAYDNAADAEVQSLSVSSEAVGYDVEVGEGDGIATADYDNPEFEDIDFTTDGEEAEALDVEGLKQKRLVAIGKLQIPSIDVDLPVVEGAGKTELHYALGHVRSTVDFGREGNSVIAGHRNYTYGSMLNRLGEVKVGDTIITTMRDGTVVTYEVYECIDVTPGDQQTTNFRHDERRITIVSCTPIGVATHRLLVRGHVVSIEPPK